MEVGFNLKQVSGVLKVSKYMQSNLFQIDFYIFFCLAAF